MNIYPRDCSDVEYDLGKVSAYLHIVRCLYVVFRDEDWQMSSLFLTYITYEGKGYNVIDYGGNFVNIIFKLAIEKMGFKVELHLQLYKVTWFDKDFHSVTQYCLVPV